MGDKWTGFGRLGGLRAPGGLRTSSLLIMCGYLLSGASATAQVERLFAPLPEDAALVTVLDAHPATLSWLGSVAGHRIYPLGVERFGQAGDIPDLYRAYGIDTDAILDAAARACLRRVGAP